MPMGYLPETTRRPPTPTTMPISIALTALETVMAPLRSSGESGSTLRQPEVQFLTRTRTTLIAL
jgi:hypothetical protein